MINDNTILSSFNDRPTLLEWLKKVEEALKTDTAKSVSVENPDTNVYIIKITFADGSVMQTEPVKLPDSVNGVSISNNHLIITTQGGIREDLGVINPYADTIVLNSETNTTEIGNNVEVDGNLKVNGAYVDSNGNMGETGEYLMSTAIGTQWKKADGLKLWRHRFTKEYVYYDILMFTNKKAPQLSSVNPCLPLQSGGPSIDIQYFTGILLVQGASIYLTYLITTDGKINPSQLNITDFEETITEYEP